ncbi:MAG: hypothetical protein HW374_356 [Bacteroidetes bacterium]|nr:hypothetical protein [Bacteroidota bacterium]
MKHRALFATLIACVLILSMGSDAFAQNKRVGTAAATELLIPIGGRDLAMGGSGIASSQGLEAIYWNPGGLGRLAHCAEAMFSSMSYIANLGVTYGAVGASFGEFGVVALSIKSLTFGDINVTTVDDPDGLGGRFFSPTFVTAGLSFGRALTDVVSVGGTVKVVSEQIDRVSASAVAFDFGVQYHRLGGINGLAIGVAVKNIGSRMKFEGSGLFREALASNAGRGVQQYQSESAPAELPSLVEMGLSYTMKASDELSYQVNSSFTNNNLYLDEYRLGGEVGFTMSGFQLFGRFGAALVPKGENPEQEDLFGTTFGAGLITTTAGIEFTLDYAYRSVKIFDANQVLSLKFGF